MISSLLSTALNVLKYLYLDDATGGQFIWTPPLSLPDGTDYALQITQNNQHNYFGPFTVQGAVPASISAASATPKSPATGTTSKKPRTSSTRVASTHVTHSSTPTRIYTSATRPSQSSPSKPTRSSQASKSSKGSHHPSHLSTGAAIGIGIAVAVVFIGIIAALGFVCYRKRLRTRSSPTAALSSSSDADGTAESPAQTNEIDSKIILEKDSRSLVGELATSSNTHELEGKARTRPYELPEN